MRKEVKSRGSTDRAALKRRLREIRDGDKCREVDGDGKRLFGCGLEEVGDEKG
jgi:hypothetical protein